MPTLPHENPRKELYEKLGITVCSNYIPLRRKVVKVEMESEWQTRMWDKNKIAGTVLHDIYHPLYDEEARAEGGKNATWAWLQDALYGKGGYPKNTPLARIEFERRVQA